MWLKNTDVACLHCGTTFRFRPCTIGVSIYHNVIRTRGTFCSFFCAKAYVVSEGLLTDSVLMFATTKIFKDFISNPDKHDDPRHIQYISGFEHFAQIPKAPDRHEYRRYGGIYEDDDVWKFIQEKQKVVKATHVKESIFLKRLGVSNYT